MAGPQLSTGLPGLDRVLKGLIPGDNIVWQVDSVDDYVPFVEPYWEDAVRQGRRPVYFRFAKHPPLITSAEGGTIHQLQPEAGFEKFITDIHRVINETGRGGWYVFDCLSDLAGEWLSDRMLGNFFVLTCPYLFDMEAIAYFSLLKNCHSLTASTTIAETTQVLLDVYRHKGRLYVHPIKVQQRHSPTMYMLHGLQKDELTPVTDSSTISEILSSTAWAGFGPARARLGIWNRAFLEAEKAIDPVGGQCCIDFAQDLCRRLLKMLVTREERVLALAEGNLNLEDILAIWRRLVGTGLIGGKAVGMLLARGILRKADPRWNDVLETHDSFYIGSDVFYTYLVQNGCWWVRQKQKDPLTFLEGSEEARRRILTGTFPDSIRKEFSDMLDYFGQCPIIVRSSSLLEDNFSNAFAGKYESVFCVNQGSRDKRLEDFMSAVRTIYASAMSEKALRYRAQRNILDRDEQMSLLVQRVSGVLHGNLLYPQVAGVGFSFNPYAWNEEIDPSAGMLRLVFGLGTRAVDRTDDDYTRVVALNAPERRPESSFDEVRRYTQRHVDVLDLAANQIVSMDFGQVARTSTGLNVRMFASQDEELERMAAGTGADVFPWVLTFEQFLRDTPFVSDMREMLRTLQDAYGCPVDVEFTANFFGRAGYKINIVQCRPLQVSGTSPVMSPPADLREEEILLRARGAVIGRSRAVPVDRIVYVVPSIYANLPIAERYSIARLIGRIMHHDDARHPRNIMLLGPGRWGTTTPALGVPVSFAEISKVSVLCEIVAMRQDLVPDVSLGTHFFSDLVESDILYMALFPGKEGNALNEQFLETCPNRLPEILPEAGPRARALRVIDAQDLGGPGALQLNANTLQQEVLCYLKPRGETTAAPSDEGRGRRRSNRMP